MRNRRLVVASGVVVILIAMPVLNAQHPGAPGPPASMPHAGRGGMGMGRGMMGADHDAATMAEMRVIHELFVNHDRITRTVTNLSDGIRTVTESTDPRTASLIKEHVAGMDRRVSSGNDPGLPIESQALHSIFAGHDAIRTTIETTDRGVIVIQTSPDPKTVAALQQHASEVTDFVKEGMAAMRAAMIKNHGGTMPAGMRGMPGRRMGAGALHTSATQDPHAGMNQRGAMVMGFDQEKTTHHFYLYEDGGAIDVSVKDTADTTNRDAIRAHLPHIAMLFGQGNFEAPMMVHDSKNVPGTAELARLKEKIAYKYKETPKGGRVDIVTTDPAALNAVHDFMKFQIADHKTGDPLEVKKR
jgi:hypothetical protein